MSEDYFKEAQSIAAQTKATRILRYFPNSDLRLGHLGLSQVARSKGIETKNLKPGEFLVFVNTAKNRLKIFAPGNVVAYLVSPDLRRLDLRVIPLIPRFFNGSEFNYPGALREVLKKAA